MRRFITLATLLFLIASCSGGAAPAETSTTTSPTTAATSPTTTPSSTATTSTEAPGDGPAVPALECRSLVTTPEIEDTLDIWNRPSGEMNTVGISRGEVCGEVIDGHDEVYVRLEPGEPGDFAPGAQLVGVTGEPVSGVGDEALWFGEVDAAGNGVQGVLSVHQSTSLGELYFRIALGRPDLDGAAQQEVAKTLALAALPRFPGVGPSLPEPCEIECPPSGFYH